MTKLYLFLSLFALQLFLVTPSVIGKYNAENSEELLSLEVNKTVPESTDPKTPPFLIMNDKDPGEASSFQHLKCTEQFHYSVPWTKIVFQGGRFFLSLSPGNLVES